MLHVPSLPRPPPPAPPPPPSPLSSSGLGLMEVVPTLYHDGHTHRFHHRHLQDYLAAHHVMANTYAFRRPSLIADICQQSHMLPVLRYIAGKSGEIPQPTSVWSIAFNTLDMKFFRSISSDHLEFMYYAFEFQSPQELRTAFSLMLSEGHCIQPRSILGLLDCYVIGYCMVNSGKMWSRQEFKKCRINERGVAMMSRALDSSQRCCFSLVSTLDLSHNPIADPGLGYIGKP